MNLVKMLADELKDKHLNDFEKARYIYLRCCEIFSFDARVYFTDLFDDSQLRNKIVRKRFNIENINEFLVVCHSFNRTILKPLIENLTNLKCDVVKDRSGHSYLIIEYLGNEWILDATNKDLARVKLSLPTEGFTSCVEKMDLLIPEIDTSLGFTNKSADDYRSLITGDDAPKMVMSIGRIIKDSKAKYYYSDAAFLFDEVLQGPTFSDNNEKYVGFNYDFHRLIAAPRERGYSYFELSKGEDEKEYSIKKMKRIDYDVAKKYLKHKK